MKINKPTKLALFTVGFFAYHIAIVSLGFVGGCVYSSFKHAKDYEAACLFKDILNNARDFESPVGPAVDSLYKDWTKDIDSGIYNFYSLREEDLEEYYWCY